jgi:hypothetical protein
MVDMYRMISLFFNDSHANHIAARDSYRVEHPANILVRDSENPVPLCTKFVK